MVNSDYFELEQEREFRSHNFSLAPGYSNCLFNSTWTVLFRATVILANEDFSTALIKCRSVARRSIKPSLVEGQVGAGTWQGRYS